MIKETVRGQRPRLPDAAGDAGGTTGDGPPLRLLLLGDSTAAGVGAEHHRDALAGQVATALTALTGRSVSWRVAARSGATVREMRSLLLGQLTDPTRRWEPDLILLAAGTNDAMRGRRPGAFRQDVERLIGDIRLRLGRDVPIALAGLPDLAPHQGLPPHVRGPLSSYVRLLDRKFRQVAVRGEVLFHVPAGGPPRFAGGWLASDRFHPSVPGYRGWARNLAAGIATLLETGVCPGPAATPVADEAGAVVDEAGAGAVAGGVATGGSGGAATVGAVGDGAAAVRS
ncbi:SGNH/GDSL hydrolase family protein [Streptomyces genisteinicus]|uniref:SGNH/GDSL hydrolase family protein n=1 Tax=Streptomyces genisteinicus TaxID=2768068 RepID=A0A7H0HVA6_9ACTN|nr:SGNH/GDSL hydrolase family protein [Streptomyces genisteinicus]QNP64472.1 SGNH/GDSL hydrolase family protein [Streptomyces genisteinicus]